MDGMVSATVGSDTSVCGLTEKNMLETLPSFLDPTGHVSGHSNPDTPQMSWSLYDVMEPYFPEWFCICLRVTSFKSQ